MKQILLYSLSLTACFSAFSQEEQIRSVNHSTLYGTGIAGVYDTYLSPIRYKGIEIRLLDESNRMSKYCGGNKLSIQSRIDIAASLLKNPSGTATEYTAFADWSWGYFYRFHVTEKFRLLAGGLTGLAGGVVYNPRNGNNPVSLKANLALSLSGMAIYRTNLWQQPITMRLQVSTPVAGMAFSPQYGQSYYEIFGLGNYDNILYFSSWKNTFACKTLLSVDIPLNRFTIRIAYLHNMHFNSINGLTSELFSSSFLIGLSTELVKIN
ncbi:MAG: DUF3316 domain-containing protein [Bacteroidales bacterium]|jgi:hypothetical protein|nr:DUF3316 domain-containing protein [Bacteroidales bacterium]